MRISRRAGGAARLILLLTGLALWAGCAPKPAPFEGPLESRLILQMPYYSDDRAAGGPAALAGVLSYSGRATTADEAVLNLGDKPPLPQALAVWARQVGMKADFAIGGTPEELVEAVKANRPLIVRLDRELPPVRAGDYAVVVGYTPEGPVLNAGLVNQQIMSWSDFLAAWHQARNLIIRVEPLGASPTP